MNLEECLAHSSDTCLLDIFSNMTMANTKHSIISAPLSCFSSCCHQPPTCSGQKPGNCPRLFFCNQHHIHQLVLLILFPKIDLESNHFWPCPLLKPYSKPPICIFRGCSNKSSQTWWLKTEIHYFTVLEPYILVSRGWQGYAPYKESRGQYFRFCTF